MLTLVATLSLMGIPLPAHAAGEESRALTIHGLPLSKFLNRRATGDPLRLAGFLAQESGRISGVALGGEGRPLVQHAVQLTRTSTVGGSAAEQIGGTGTTDMAGGFSFTGLPAGNYLVEVLRGGEVVASTPTTLAEGAMHVTGLTVTVLAESRLSRGEWIAASAGMAAGVLLLLGFVRGFGGAVATTGRGG